MYVSLSDATDSIILKSWSPQWAGLWKVKQWFLSTCGVLESEICIPQWVQWVSTVGILYPWSYRDTKRHREKLRPEVWFTSWCYHASLCDLKLVSDFSEPTTKWSGLEFLKLSCASQFLRNLVNRQNLIWWGLRFCFCNKFPNEAHSAGLWVARVF